MLFSNVRSQRSLKRGLRDHTYKTGEPHPRDTSGLWQLQSKDGPKAAWRNVRFSPARAFGPAVAVMADLDNHGAGVFRLLRAGV